MLTGALSLIGGLVRHVYQISEYLKLRRRLSRVRGAGGSWGHVLLAAYTHSAQSLDMA
jgi:hypothetical protein